MSEPKQTNSALEADNQTSEQQESKPVTVGLSRRTFLGAGSAGLATAALASFAVNAQERADTEKAEQDHSASNTGPENKPLLDENPNSNFPPPTDHGNIDPVWYSFDLTHKRVQEGGWTNEVTEKVLPSSKDLAGVRMRLTAGSFRELHWHVADEWAYMLYGNARVSVLSPDGTIFIDDVAKGDLWYFPAGLSFDYRWLSGRLWTSRLWNLCLFHEREHDFNWPKDRTGPFRRRVAFCNRRSILRQRQFSGKSNDSVQIASFTSLDFRPDCRPSCDRCGSCSTWPVNAPSQIAMLSVPMGMMNPALSKIGAESVSLTFVTGNLRRIGGHLASAAGRNPLPDAQGPGGYRRERATNLIRKEQPRHFQERTGFRIGVRARNGENGEYNKMRSELR
jgi:Cupin